MTCNPFHRSLTRATTSHSASHKVTRQAFPRRQNDSASSCGRSASELRGAQTHSHPALPGRGSIFFVSVVLPVRRNKVSKSHALACVLTPNVTLLCWLDIFQKAWDVINHLVWKENNLFSMSTSSLRVKRCLPHLNETTRALTEPQHLSGLGLWMGWNKGSLSEQTRFFRQGWGCRTDKICQLKYSHGSKLVNFFFFFCRVENLCWNIIWQSWTDASAREISGLF